MKLPKFEFDSLLTNMKHFKKSTFLLASAALSFAANTQAAEVSTKPVGYTTWTVNAGTGTARVFTTLALPLYQPTSGIDGSSSGVITGVTSSTLSVSGAGWTTGQLSNASAPFCVRITSGTAEGRNLLISTTVDNTADTLTIDTSGVDLTTLGLVASTDTFEIIECDTLGSLFPAPSAGGLVGGSTLEDADQVWIFVNGTLERYYYDTDLGYWTKEVSRGAQPDSSNQIISPDDGFLFSRKDASTSEFIIPGTVPTTARNLVVSAAGLTFVGASWPVDTTLADTNIEGIEGWTNGTSSSSTGADTVFIFSSGTRSEYYFDGTNWRVVSARNPAISDDVPVESGSAVVISKTTPHTNDVVLTQTVPYSL